MSPHAHSGPHQADHARCGQGRRKFRNAKHCRAPRGGKRWLRSSTPMYSARPAAPEGSRHPRCRLSAHPPHQQRTLPSGSRRGATRRPSHHHASACSPLSLFFFSCTALARNFIFRSLLATLHCVWHVPGLLPVVEHPLAQHTHILALPSWSLIFFLPPVAGLPPDEVQCCCMTQIQTSH